MTSLSLLLWIVLGIALQVALWLGIGFWRHWSEYQSLRSGVPAPVGEMAAEVATTVASEPANVSAWAGFRPFRVERRVVENTTQSICSFYLVSEGGQPLPAFLPGQFLTF